MAKQKKEINWNQITKVCAFLAIVIAGVIYLINALLQLFGGSASGGILNTVATVLLVVALIIPAWRFVKGKKVWIQVLFWVCAIVLIVCGAFSMNI